MNFFSKSNSNRRIAKSGARKVQSILQVTGQPDLEGNIEAKRRFFLGCKITLGVMLAGSVLLGGRFTLKRLIWENPSYAISDIRFTTDGMLTRAQVLDTLELWEGRNIFTIDTSKLRASLDALPQVERAEIRRILPDRVDIRVVERQPVAWIADSPNVELKLGGNAYLVDARGMVMRNRKMLPEYMALPLIVGVNMEDVAPGQRLPSPEAHSAIELIRLSAEDAVWQPRVVDVGKGYCIVATDARKAKITFGFDGLENQLSRLHQLIEAVEPMQRDLQTVNLMLERNIPVTFAPPPQPVTPVSDPKSKAKAASKLSTTSPAATSAVTAEQISKAQAASPLTRLMAKQEQVSSTPVSAPLPMTAPVNDPGPTAVLPSVFEKPVQKATPLPVALEAQKEMNPKAKPVKVPEPVKQQETPRAPEPKPSKAEPEKEPAQARPLRKKAEPVAEAAPPKAVPVDKPSSQKPVPAAVPPGTLTPNEKLRKLFQPHG